MNFGLIPLITYKPTFKLMAVPIDLPESVDLRNKFPAVYDQGTLGSCTANAVVAAYQYLNKKHYGSRLFLYYNTRMLDKTINYDAGSTLTQTINAAKKYGICQDNNWAYSPSRFKIRPKIAAYTNARPFVIQESEPIMPTITQLKACLAEGYPFICGILVYSSFMSAEVRSTGRVPLPQSGEEIIGGHAIVCVGYNKDGWIMRNSWGPRWGDRGHFYLPYSYLIDEMACDFWKITKVYNPSDKKVVKKPTKLPNVPLKMQFIGGRLI